MCVREYASFDCNYEMRTDVFGCCGKFLEYEVVSVGLESGIRGFCWCVIGFVHLHSGDA